MAGRQLRGVHTDDAVKAFVRAGGALRGGKGSHRNLKMPNGQIITLPVRKELKIGLLKSALRKAGLTEDQFMELLGRT